MQLSERHIGTVTIVDVSGGIAAEEGEPFRRAIGRILELGHRDIVLDLAHLSHVDSTALGQLVACQIRAARYGTTLKLANPTARLQDLLVVTRLLTVFESFESLDAALASFPNRRGS